jgi:Tfp pilus assembly protein PilX
MTAFRRERGAVLVAVLIMAIIVAVFCVTSLLVSHMESQGTNASIQRDEAFFVASAGLEDEFKALSDLMAKSSLKDPFKSFEALAGQTVIRHRPLTSGGVTIGQYDVVVNSISAVDVMTRDITLTATGYVPSADDPRAISRTITAVVRVGTGRSHVFDYVYFINNWGWYFGSTIIANGNVRANGQFDFGNYASTVNGLARFDGMSNGLLGDPLDGGGAYAGWNIVNGSKVKGTTVGPDYTHAFDDQLPMPNLTDLTIYEKLATQNKSNITIGGNVMCNAVVGDETGELPNLYLEGKDKYHPIVLNGPVVVRGNLIIKGYVTGKGALYVQGNAYIAGDLKYCNPIEATPTKTDKATQESWVQRNQSADALGLFARDHIVVGNFTDASWQSYVSQWVYDKRNDSNEDAGEDGIPNTRAGRDGILRTADDDVLEGDGKWTVESYTTADAQQGSIPTGSKVGDTVPGTGEDIDGDGKYDPGTRMSDFNLNVTLNKKYWQGNFPNPLYTIQYRDICKENKITQLDGAFYTNHSLAMITLAYDKDLTINGCLVSRNEDIIYGTKHAIFNYDLRLLEDTNPHGLVLPTTWNPLRMVMWRSN